MAIKFLEGFDSYGGEGNPTSSQWTSGDTSQWASGNLKVSDECSYYGRGLIISVDRLANGKWRLQINGSELIFDKRPEFTMELPDAQ